MQTELKQIRSAIFALVNDRLKENVDTVTVELTESEDGDEYILVTVKLINSSVDDEALEKTLEDVESEVARLDDRYPSVRFLDAA